MKQIKNKNKPLENFGAIGAFWERQRHKESCRHCNCWNYWHKEGNKCLVWKQGGQCDCPKWESNDNLKYLLDKYERSQ